MTLLNCTTRTQIISALTATIRRRPVQDAVAGVFRRARLLPPRPVQQRLEQLLEIVLTPTS